MDKIEQQGERDFYNGKDLPDNPYPRDSEEARKWQRGMDYAFDEYVERHKSWYGERTGD